MITQKQVEDTICSLYRDSVIELPKDVKNALKEAYANENDETARLNLKAIIDNIEAAHENSIPMCQDTGLPIVFVKLGDVTVENLYQGIRNGVEKATITVPLRPNVVDPFTREKGIEGVKKFVLETVLAAGGKPCPPTRIGVGIGGSSDYALKLAKKALLRDVNSKNSDKRLAELEEELLESVNSTGIGPMGLGGKTTALDVKVELADTHTAGLPIGVCIQCWAARHASAILKD